MTQEVLQANIQNWRERVASRRCENNYRCSHQRCSIKEAVLRIFTKFTGKHLCQSLFFKKVADLLKKKLWHRCFPVNFVKVLRTPFLQNIFGRLLPNLTNRINLKFCRTRETCFWKA